MSYIIIYAIIIYEVYRTSVASAIYCTNYTYNLCDNYDEMYFNHDFYSNGICEPA